MLQQLTFVHVEVIVATGSDDVFVGTSGAGVFRGSGNQEPAPIVTQRGP